MRTSRRRRSPPSPTSGGTSTRAARRSWGAAPGGRLSAPGLQGPPAALLTGQRDGEPTTLTVSDAATGRVVLSRRVGPGPFELALVAPPVYGPLARAAEYIVSCDRPRPLP